MRREAREAARAFKAEYEKEVASGVDKALGPSPKTKESGRKLGEDAGEAAGGAFHDAVQKRVRAALKALPQVKVEADTSQAQRELARIRTELKRIGDAHAKFDLDSGGAMAQIAGLSGALLAVHALAERGSEIDIDTGQAIGHLAALEAVTDVATRDRTINVDADTGKANAQMAATSSAAHLLSRDGQDTANSFRAFNIVILATAALSAGLIPIIGALAGVVAGLAAAAIGAGAGLGIAVLGLSGIPGAVKALMDVEKNAAKDALQSSKTVRNAYEAVADAERGLSRARQDAAESAEDSARRVARAQQDAARAVQSAQRRYQDALRSEKRTLDDVREAQEALREARRLAQQDLDDIADRARRNSVNERQAVIDLFNASVEDTAARQDPGATNLEREQAAINLENARIRLEEIREEQGRIRQEQAKAQREGVNGTDRVIQAQDRVVEALERQREAHRSVGEAAQAVDRARVDGAEAVADAVRAQRRSEADSAQAVADAQRRLVRSQQDYQDALQQTQTIGSSSMQKLEEAMGKLSPAGRRFARWIYSLRGGFLELRQIVETGFLPGLQSGLQSFFDRYGPGFKEFVGTMAGLLGELSMHISDTLQSPLWESFFGTMKEFAPIFTRQFVEIMLNLAGFVAALLDAFAPFSANLGDGIVALTASWKKWAEGLKDSEGFQRFLGWLREVLPEVGHFFGTLFSAAINLGRALAPLGRVIMGIVTAVLGWIAAMDPKILGAIVGAVLGLVFAFQIAVGVAAIVGGAFTILASPIALIAFIIGVVVAAIILLYTQSETARKIINGAFRFIIEYMKFGWKYVWKPILMGIIGLFKGVASFLQWMWKHVWKPVFSLIIAIIEAWWKATRRAWRDFIKPIFDAFMDLIGDDLVKVFKTGMEQIGKAWDSLKNLAKKPIRFVVDTVINKGIIGAFNKVAGFFGVDKKDQMPKIKLPAGFSRGGYTGAGGRYEPAGIVHRDEYVISAPARRRFERRNPGLLDYLNTTGSLPGYAGGGLVFPAPRGVYGSPYGPRGNNYHTGQDFPAPMGSAVVAALAGVVRLVRNLGNRSYGKYIELQHAMGLQTLYAHLSAFNVRQGQNVFPGQVIGRVGSTGNSTGPHLHFEYQPWGHAVNPRPYLRGAAYTPGKFVDGDGPGFLPNPLAWLRSKVAGPISEIGNSKVGTILKAIPHRILDLTKGAFTGLLGGVVNFGKSAIGKAGDAIDFLNPFNGGGDDDKPNLYDNGGWLPPGLSTVFNATGRPEPVLTPEQWERMVGGNTYDLDINLNGSDVTAADVADELLFTVRRIGRGGAYAPGGAG